MNNLKFRRQFLFTPVKCKQLEKWQVEKVDKYFIYVHPDCQFEKSFGINDLYLIGYFFNPHDTKKTSKEILNSLSSLKDINNFPNKLYSLVGRFVLIIKTENDFIFFNDACGLRTFYYAKNNNNIYAASQPLLINKVLQIKKTKAYEDYFNSDYVAKNLEHWLPSGVTFYENVYHLVPNHYIKASEFEQKRYYPFQNLKPGNYSESVIKFSTLLKNIVSAANNNMDLAFTLTAGWDTRIILSSCKDIIDDVTFYTLRYRNMDDKHMDIKIPVSLSKSLNLKFNIFDCQKNISPEFAKIYESNTDMAHIDDWGKIAFGMSEIYPQEKVAVKGNCSEIGLCLYFPERTIKNNLTENDFLQLKSGWGELNFIREGIRKWNELIKGNSFNYNLYDLFYWEHRMGSWQAQSQLEWDIVQEVFTPFNSRELLDLMLSIDKSKRKKSSPLLYVDAMKHLWKEVLDEPINPLPFKKKTRRLAVVIVRKAGLVKVIEKHYKK